MDSLSPLLAALGRLRRWILGFGAAFLLLCVPGWFLSARVIGSLQGLLGGEALYETFVGEALWSRMVVAMALAVALLLPAVGCAASRRYGLCAAGTVLFLLGVAFGRGVLLPFTVAFLQRAGDGFAQRRLAQLSYVGMCLGLLAAVGLVFLLPLALSALHGAGLVEVKGLRKARPRVILGSVVLMAILTPTQDAVTLAIAAAPVIALYETGILWLRAREAALRRWRNRQMPDGRKEHA